MLPQNGTEATPGQSVYNEREEFEDYNNARDLDEADWYAEGCGVLGDRRYAIPREMRRLDRWLLWKRVTRPNEPKPAKVPVSPRTGRVASATDPQSATSLDIALMSLGDDSRGGDGVGLMLLGDGIAGIDLDHARDPETGEPLPWAVPILDQFAMAGAYIEVSPSGTGYRSVVRATLPNARNKVVVTDGGEIECYARNRYLTITGVCVSGGWADELADGQKAIDWLYETYYPTSSDDSHHTPTNGAGFSGADEDLMRVALAARNGNKLRQLMDGDTSAYAEDDSRADLALAGHLAFWCGPDPERIERLMRQSRLARSKWERNGDNYLARTVATALDGRTEFYKPRTAVVGDADDPFLKLTTAEGLSEQGDAMRFVREYTGCVCYCYEWKTWLAWDGVRWVRDNAAAFRYTQESARRFLAEAVKLPEAEMKRALVHGYDALTKRRIDAVLGIAKNYLTVNVADLDRNHLLLNCPNGTIDLRTGELLPHDPANLMTTLCPTEYHPDVCSPVVTKFLEEIFPDDPELLGWVQKLIGYGITGSTCERVLTFLHGSGSNGKGTLIEALLAAIGCGYSHVAPSSLLLAKGRNAGGASNDRADLFGKRLVICSETREGAWLDEELVKSLTGSDTINARQLYERAFTFNPTHTLIVQTNNKPNVSNLDQATRDRLRFVPFKGRWSANPQEGLPTPDRTLPSRLREPEQAQAVLALAVAGCLRWQAEGLGVCDAVTVATDEYFAEQDTLGQFIDEECNLGRPTAWVRLKELSEALVTWAKSQGVPCPAKGRKLSAEMQRRGFEKFTSNGTCFRGLALIVSHPSDRRPLPVASRN